METQFCMEGVGVPRFSSRDVTQTLAPLGGTGARMRRTVNGELCYLGATGHHKYVSEVSCQDETIPGIHQGWIGKAVQVQCLCILHEVHAAGADVEPTMQLSRPAVPGSVTVHESAIEGQVLVSYRPLLNMRITGFDLKTSEWSAGTQWSLTLEEI